MDRETYIVKGLLEHLSYKEVYQKIPKQKPIKTHIVRYKMSLFLSKYKVSSLEPCRKKLLSTQGPSKKSRETSKIQNQRQSAYSPWKLRPIVSCAGTTLTFLSRWLDYWFQKFKPQINTYIKDAPQLFQKLKEIKQLP